MQITTYYVTHRLPTDFADADAAAMVDLINDTGYGNGDNHSWNAMRARIDEVLDAETQRRLGVALVAESIEADEDA